MSHDDLICPRCGGREFRELDCGPDSWEDDIYYISHLCQACGLYYSGWTERWLIDCDTWQDEADCEEWQVP